MMNLIKPGTRYDFMGGAPFAAKVSIGTFVGALLVLAVMGLNLGLDFSGGHEILLAFEKDAGAEAVRGKLANLFPGVDTSVQSFEVPTEPTKFFYLTRIQRSEAFGEQEVEGMKQAFATKYGAAFKRLRYNAEAGDVVEVEFVAGATTGVDLSDGALSGVVAGTKHEVRLVRRVGRPEQLRWSVVLKGVDASVVAAMTELDPNVKASRVEFVGPTVGKQLRDDGLLAVFYALICILIYVAVRFDFFYSPGAVICLFHDAVITAALLVLVGEQFTLATIAGLLTLVGYSINDTIVVFDRIRETVGKAQGGALKDQLNKAVNETLGRTVMTSLTTLLSCVALMVFGAGTVLASFGLIMFIGIIIGTYSSIFVATPIFRYLRDRFGQQDVIEKSKASRQTAVV